jgi:hypothetical protein
MRKFLSLRDFSNLKVANSEMLANSLLEHAQCIVNDQPFPINIENALAILREPAKTTIVIEQIIKECFGPYPFVGGSLSSNSALSSGE